MSRNIKKDWFFSENTGKFFAIGGIIFIILAAIIFLTFRSWSFSSTIKEEIIGQYGDFISGVVGSLFSLAGVILFYVALTEQRKDMGINQKGVELQIKALNHQVEEFQAQKAELEETRKVYEEQTILFREQTDYYSQQAKEYKKQTCIANLQQFDSSFYSILNIFIQLRNELNNRDQEKNFFSNIYSSIKTIDVKNKSIPECYDLINKKYNEICDKNASTLSYYLKIVYRIIKLIDSGNIEDSEKTQYAKIFRSQLTDDELLLLYYNSHSIFGTKVRPIVIKYELFKHLKILDKVEYRFVGEYDMKAKLTSLLNSLSILIKSNYALFNDIESDSDINICESHRFVDLDSEITLIINANLELYISFEKNAWMTQKVLSKEFVNEIISMDMYDILFLSKYKIPSGEEIKVEYIESDTSFKIKFSIDNIKNI